MKKGLHQQALSVLPEKRIFPKEIAKVLYNNPFKDYNKENQARGIHHMKNIYTIAEANRENVKKLIARLEKKADKYGCSVKAVFGETYVKEIPIYYEETAYNDNRTAVYEVFDLEIESEIVKIEGGFEVIAGIEHYKEGNIVYNFTKERKPEWTMIKPYCRHCNSNHNLKKTFIVQSEDGEEKQVGKTCLKDYCGIDPQAVGISNELNYILIKEDVEHYDFRHVESVFNVKEVLALAIEIVERQGYIKSGEANSNKGKIVELLNKHAKSSEKALEKAEMMIEVLKAMPRDEAFKEGLDTVQTIAIQDWTKSKWFGYIAYAPVQIERYLEKKRKKEEQKANESSSEYIGTVGQRLTFRIKEYKVITCWETDYGYTFLQKFVTEEGNILIWYGSKTLAEFDNGMTRATIKATIKDHSERNGIRQTVITRCAVV